MDQNEHSGAVDAWMKRSAEGLSSARWLSLFERAFAGLWQRSHRTLGDVTLMAIVDRVLCDGMEQFPLLAKVHVDANGLHCSELRQQLDVLPREQLFAALRLVLVDFLTVLGNLTAEILSPALHAELAKVAPEEEGQS